MISVPCSVVAVGVGRGFHPLATEPVGVVAVHLGVAEVDKAVAVTQQKLDGIQLNASFDVPKDDPHYGA